MILLDTHAVLWLESGHRRARALAAAREPLYLSPITALELQLLYESRRFRVPNGTVDTLLHDDRWLLDDPPAAAWFEAATSLSWTRDPFDRLFVAHARYRGWRLATADAAILEHLSESERIEL